MKRRLGIVCVLVLVSACGKKGPPLPPLIRLPAAPADFTVSRRGGAVAIDLVVPGANTDGSTPADLSRVDVYALTDTAAAAPEDVVRRGRKVGSIVVNLPPDEEEEGDLPPEEIEAKKLPNGVDQRSAAHLRDSLADAGGDASAVRSYVAVGFNLRGRRGALTGRSVVPLGQAPPAPSAPTLSYDEKNITLVWTPPTSLAGDTASYQVYAPGEIDRRLTNRPVREPRYQEARREWGVERCYVVRTIGAIDGVAVESDASPRVCRTPVDTFAPAAPAGLQAVASQNAIDLIWNPNTEDDLAGYLVLRSTDAGATLVPVNATLLQEATFRDTVPSGTRATYAIRAVDKAGNRSEPSTSIQETAR